MERSVIREEYNSVWADEYEKEAKKTKDILGTKIIGIEHIGSTSVKGVGAKYLRNFPKVRKQYNQLKKVLAEKYCMDRVLYTSSKAPFIEEVINKAKKELKCIDPSLQ